MADARDAFGATSDADSSQRSLVAYCGGIESGERDPSIALVVGLAAVAICDRLHELTMRVDYLTHDVLKEPRHL
jgi:hypothetical protein